jgi:hypothetical protein
VIGDFAFWVGTWDVRWEGGSGTNTITAELDGTPLLERFESAELRGMSLTVHDGTEWRQAWVDGNRTYLDFHGGPVGDELHLVHSDDNRRMRFTDINADSLVWLWERRDGEQWELVWRIDYARSGS